MSDQLEWSAARGTGKVYSHSTVYRALVPGFEDDVPYVVAMIELDEGVRLLSQVIYCEPEEVFIGLRVPICLHLESVATSRNWTSLNRFG